MEDITRIGRIHTCAVPYINKYYKILANIDKYWPIFENSDQIVKNEFFVKRACRKVGKCCTIEIKKLKKLILALRVSFFKEVLTFETLSFLSDFLLSSNRGVGNSSIYIYIYTYVAMYSYIWPHMAIYSYIIWLHI